MAKNNPIREQYETLTGSLTKPWGTSELTKSKWKYVFGKMISCWTGSYVEGRLFQSPGTITVKAQSPRVCRWEKLLEWPHGPGGKRSVIFCGANPWSQAILNKSKILATAGWKIHGWSTCVCVWLWRLSQEGVTALFSHSVRVPRGSSDGSGGAYEVWNTELLLSQMFPLLWVLACARVHVKRKSSACYLRCIK